VQQVRRHDQRHHVHRHRPRRPRPGSARPVVGQLSKESVHVRSRCTARAGQAFRGVGGAPQPVAAEHWTRTSRVHLALAARPAGRVSQPNAGPSPPAALRAGTSRRSPRWSWPCASRTALRGRLAPGPRQGRAAGSARACRGPLLRHLAHAGRRLAVARERRAGAGGGPRVRAFNLASTASSLETLDYLAQRFAGRPGLELAVVEVSEPQLVSAALPWLPDAAPRDGEQRLLAWTPRECAWSSTASFLIGENLARLPALLLLAPRLDGSEVTMADQLAAALGARTRRRLLRPRFLGTDDLDRQPGRSAIPGSAEPSRLLCPWRAGSRAVELGWPSSCRRSRPRAPPRAREAPARPLRRASARDALPGLGLLGIAAPAISSAARPTSPPRAGRSSAAPSRSRSQPPGC